MGDESDCSTSASSGMMRWDEIEDEDTGNEDGDEDEEEGEEEEDDDGWDGMGGKVGFDARSSSMLDAWACHISTYCRSPDFNFHASQSSPLSMTSPFVDSSAPLFRFLHMKDCSPLYLFFPSS